MEDKNNMICNVETGICGDGDSGVTEFIDLTAPKKKEVTDKDNDESKQN